MEIIVCQDRDEIGASAGKWAAERLRLALARQECVNLVLATGTSQFEVLRQLAGEAGIAWERVTCFHLDEYVGIPDTHPASFRKYLRERFAAQVPSLGAFHYVQGDAADPAAECKRLNALIQAAPVDLALIGIGENGHLAFNDPPADFQIEEPYIVVDLDEKCRMQQVGEGWFPSLAAVPHQAISMSIRQIMKSEYIICSVPDARKAEPVRAAVEGPLTPWLPASILRQHPHCRLYLDRPAAALLSR
jgi:glucosamine-6-phosphate deaminase